MCEYGQKKYWNTSHKKIKDVKSVTNQATENCRSEKVRQQSQNYLLKNFKFFVKFPTFQ